MLPERRLPAPAGSRIDRSRTVTFEFEERAYTGYTGDTIASALAAHGEWCLSRSFKLHRPRGSFGFAGDEAGSLVQLETEPNVNADLRAIEPGMRARGQNTVGSLAADWMALLERFERFMPVGFYYKAFYKPKGVWNWWEKVIRRAAGLGRVDRAWTPEYFDKAYAHCDVAVIGGGPAGLAAAAACGAEGLDVMLVEREPEVGGWLTYGRLDASGGDDGTLEDLRRRVQALPSVRVLTSATCTGWFADSWLAVTQGNRLHKIRAKAVVVCTGGTSQPAVFRNNDLPGIVAASGAQRLIRHYGVRPGLRAVVLTAGDEGYGAALDLAEHGTEVAAVVDCRLDPATWARWRLKPKHAAIEFCPATPCARPGAIRSDCRSAACWPRASRDPARVPSREKRSTATCLRLPSACRLRQVCWRRPAPSSGRASTKPCRGSRPCRRTYLPRVRWPERRRCKRP